MRFAFTLTPAESRRLIAKGVVKLEEVTKALEGGYLIIIGGTTTAFVVQELLGKEAIAPHRFPKGISRRGVLCQTHPESRQQLSFVLYRGKPVDKSIEDVFVDFHDNTVVIKGANAVDAAGNVGILMSNPDGGSMAKLFGAVISQGLTHVVPVGLEKMVPSVKEAVRAAGASRLDYTMGCDFGMYCPGNARVVTELEALKILCGVEATHVASGGVDGNEGAVTIVAEGGDGEVMQAIRLIQSIKGEAPINTRKIACTDCEHHRCAYHGVPEESLPHWLKGS